MVTGETPEEQDYSKIARFAALKYLDSIEQNFIDAVHDRPDDETP